MKARVPFWPQYRPPCGGRCGDELHTGDLQPPIGKDSAEVPCLEGSHREPAGRVWRAFAAAAASATACLRTAAKRGKRLRRRGEEGQRQLNETLAGSLWVAEVPSGEGRPADENVSECAQGCCGPV